MSENSSSNADNYKIPHDVMNEQVLIAAALVDQKSLDVLVSRVRAEHFLEKTHMIIWSTILVAVERQIVPTSVIVAQLSGGKVDKNYLDELITIYPDAPKDLIFHVETLHWDLTKTKAIQGPLTELIKSLHDSATPHDRINALAKQIPIAFQGSSTRTHLKDSDKLLSDHRELLMQRMKGIGLFPTGIDGLDFYPENTSDESGNDISGQPLLIPGLEPGKLTTVTGISGGGKSTIVALLSLLQARMYAAADRGIVLYGAWEMQPGDLLELMACISTEIPRKRVKTGRISSSELELLMNRMETIAKYVKFVDMPFHKDRGVRHSHDEVLDVIHGYIADSGASLAVFDLWRRAFRRMKDESDEQEALYRQQAIAEETKCHCILVQQQRLKDIEVRANPIPTREGIKGSSAWVDVSDTILGIYMPSLMSQSSARNVIQILVLKQRYGRWPLTIEYQWNGDIVALSKPQVVWDTAYGDEELVTSRKGTKHKEIDKLTTLFSKHSKNSNGAKNHA